VQSKVSGPRQNPPQDPKLPDEGRSAPQDQKQAASVRAGNKPFTLPRSQRVTIAIRILVYGKKKNGEPFQEETHSLVVNAHGGLIRLSVPVDLGQKLLLTNPKITQEVLATVAYLGRTEYGQTEVGVGFLEPSPWFWHIRFPPEDWDSSERKLPPRITR
jgi:hypothetical protein